MVEEGRAERRRLRYQFDAGYRQSCLISAAKARGHPPDRIVPRKQSWSVHEVLDIVGVSLKTFNRHQRLGLIPLPTYPAKVRRYWGYQVLLIVRVYQHMKKEGWPERMPRYVGSLHWSKLLSETQQRWKKEGLPHADWKARCCHHD